MEKNFSTILKELSLSLEDQAQEEKETNAQIHYSWDIKRKSLTEKIETRAKLRKATKATDSNRSYVGHWVPQQDETGWWIL